MTTTQPPNLRSIKGRQQKAWSSGGYGKVGATLVIVAETLCEAVDLRPGQKVLEVACGNGNASLAAARRFCQVVCIDYVPVLLDEGRERAGQHCGQGQRIETRVSIRDAFATDREGLRRMFSRSSSETIYRRFHIPYPEVTEQILAFMLGADKHDKQALLAVARGETVGHAMYARLGDTGDAEMAIVVEDGWQSRGVGKLLLRRLAESARGRGIETFVGTVLPENRRMLGLIDALFAGSRHVISDGVFHFRAPLRTLEPADPVRTLRCAA